MYCSGVRLNKNVGIMASAITKSKAHAIDVTRVLEPHTFSVRSDGVLYQPQTDTMVLTLMLYYTTMMHSGGTSLLYKGLS